MTPQDLLDAIARHHATKYGSNPATGASVISPPDLALYAAAGLSVRTLAPGEGRCPQTPKCGPSDRGSAASASSTLPPQPRISQ